MAPAGQGRCSGGSGRSRPCVRRLICSGCAARPDEVRRRSDPDRCAAGAPAVRRHALQGAPVRTGCSDCRFAVLSPSPHVVPEARPRRDAPHRLGAGSRRLLLSGRGGPVALARPDERPDHPRHAIGQRDGDHLYGLSLRAMPHSQLSPGRPRRRAAIIRQCHSDHWRAIGSSWLPDRGAVAGMCCRPWRSGPIAPCHRSSAASA